MKELSPIVKAIGEIRLEGNVIPHAWFTHPEFRTDSGKVSLNAVVLLADILYWYRPTVIRDEHTGAIQDVRNKFSGAKLYKNYEEWGKLFGLTKRQVQEAMYLLKRRGLITLELESVQSEGRMIGNRVFIEPVVDAIRRLSSPSPIITEDGASDVRLTKKT